MIPRFTLALAALSTVVSAQSSSVSSAQASASASASASATDSVSVPSSTSANCKAFLTDLDSDTVLSNCVTPLLTTTNAAAMSTNSTTLTSSLTKLCSANGCSETFIRTKLSYFYGNCSAELTAGADDTIRNLYDLLYVVEPLRTVVCTKDDNTNEYCVTALGANTTTASTVSQNATIVVTNGTVLNTAVIQPEVAYNAAYLSVNTLSTSSSSGSALSTRASKRASITKAIDASSAIYPNATTYKNTDLPYLFIQPTDPASILCSSCAKGVFTAYAAYESRMPYALGLSSSAILGGQGALWQAAIDTCGSTWVAGITNAANVDSSSTDSGSSSSLSGASRSVVGAWSVGALAAIVASFTLA
ncbi:hypothetical protein [Phaffia rhodozyma]|uniref:DUF7729 domain-containing protein n=1 Tax=Phaffia rhodozyma TaxID=264483 RepID=A0A0F7SUC3_PHARH|nr:hypothetical protein [Phaffia rhodozyma]